MAPVQWDGLESLRGKFWLWWTELVEATIREKGEEHITFTVNLLWHIWKDRNEINFNGKGRDPGVVVHKALTEWLEYQEVQYEGKEEGRESRLEAGKKGSWAAPNKGWIKLNTDAALNQQSNKAGWGIVARDWKGKLVATWACPSFTCSVPVLEEALAIRTAMVKAALEGWERIIIESDCKVVIDRIQGDSDDVLISTVLQDIKLLKQNFKECCFSFVHREFNSVSHTFARYALNLGSIVDWKACFPVWLLDIAQADVEEQLLQDV
ncbi:uncharacterized protein [Coffea arabica]|uniref:RNase H type-1 domain-containing protein n=1 Tax=Coffea arabica TaxID=13443 RepID=A0A6P6W5R8_COFAR|nr:uncharacterized protein LOC113729441 [Coffea arabica]